MWLSGSLDQDKSICPFATDSAPADPINIRLRKAHSRPCQYRTLFSYPFFEAATKANSLAELDKLCRKKVICRFAKLSLPSRLFINVGPITMLHEQFREGISLQFLEQAGIDPERIIIELTETHPVEDIEFMKQAMRHYQHNWFQGSI